MTARRRGRALALVPALVALACVGAGRPAHGQGLDLTGGERGAPIEINAEDGIEWQQDARAYIARGNARAVQGDVAVHADALIAYYRAAAKGGTEIWRIDADGKVRIVSRDQTAFGGKAVYDLDSAVLVLTGRPRLVTPQTRITARDSLEYWQKRSLAVARGEAVAVQGDKRLGADVLTAHFRPGHDGKSELYRIEAFDNVLVSSPEEIVRANRGVYNVETGIVVLTGSVKITRGEDQLDGEAAEVNLNTGVSRLLSGRSRRVRGLFLPRRAGRRK